MLDVSMKIAVQCSPVLTGVKPSNLLMLRDIGKREGASLVKQALQELGVLKTDYSRPTLSQKWERGNHCRIVRKEGSFTETENDEALCAHIRDFLKEKGYLRDGSFQATIIVEK